MRRGPATTLPVRWGYLYFCAVLAALSHLLLDYTTAYGIRLFEPFNFRWYSWDIVFIVEPVIWSLLIGGAGAAGAVRPDQPGIGARSKGPRGRGGAIAALICLVLLWGYRDYQHRRALNAMNSFLYHGAQPLRFAAYPYMINPFRWHGVVETTDFFETVPVNSLLPDVDSQNGQLYYKPPQTAALEAANPRIWDESIWTGRFFPTCSDSPWTAAATWWNLRTCATPILRCRGKRRWAALSG